MYMIRIYILGYNKHSPIRVGKLRCFSIEPVPFMPRNGNQVIFQHLLKHTLNTVRYLRELKENLRRL